MGDFALGVDVGGTNVKILAVSPEGGILEEQRFPTADNPQAEWSAHISQTVAEIQSRLGPCDAIGVCCPGLVASDGRGIAWMQGRLAALVGLDWTNLFQHRQPVPVLNDAHAALLGEVWLGGARGYGNVVMLTLGTGVGGAIMCDNRLLKGHLGRAGHLGHISLDPLGSKDIVHTPGSLEDAIGECTLRQRGRGRYSNTATLVQAAEAGDAEARGIWLTSLRALAAGLTSIINAVDPELVVLGGGIAQAGRALLEPLRGFLDEFEWRPTDQGVRLELAQLGDRAGAYGAAWNALNCVRPARA